MKSPLLPAILWSWLMASSFVVSAQVTAYASPLPVTFLRFLLALLIMTPFYIAGRRSHPAPLISSMKAGAQLAIVSGSLTGFFVCLFTALKTTTSLNTSVMYTFVPFLGALTGLIFSIRTTSRQWFGYLCGAAGAIIVLLATRNGGLVWHSGDAIYLAGCILLAIHVVSVQRWFGQYTAFGGAYRIMFAGTLWLLPFTLLAGGLSQVQWLAVPFWQMTGYLTIGTTLLTFVLQQRIVAQGGARCLLGISYTIPVWVACYENINAPVALLLSPGFVAGSSLVVIALVLIDNGFNHKGAANGQSLPEKTA
ncbi:DMT family transporter [Alteromonas sp. RKMC-009]|uniref:DMT family transporter n=1 Tax=Alteromonas sp. RKMC-009 TaxID=2267264 RepID=UPI000E6A1A86|nr:DMT family transporter [Alteromonas sp. RKMC-009]AYA66207.1 DMT family transporter [Alteromonas sp. RKMC-009]